MKFCPMCKKELILKQIDEKERLCCPDSNCGFVFWNNPVPIVAGIVETPEGVILAHNKAWPARIYSVITGFLESGELPEEAVKRETFEELGLNIHRTCFIGIYPFNEMNQVIMAYHVIADGKVTLNEELDDYKVIPKDKLKGWSFGTGLAVNDWVKKRVNL